MEWNISVLTVPLTNIGPHFPTDAITETSCGLKDKFVCTKLSARLIIMPITAQKPGLGGCSNLNMQRQLSSARFKLKHHNPSSLLWIVILKPKLCLLPKDRTNTCYTELTVTWSLFNKVLNKTALKKKPSQLSTALSVCSSLNQMLNGVLAHSWWPCAQWLLLSLCQQCSIYGCAGIYCLEPGLVTRKVRCSNTGIAFGKLVY